MVLALLVTAAGLFAAPAFPAQDRVTCTGRVLTAVEGTPVAGARVQVTTAADAVGRTDVDGAFQVTGLLPGRHRLLVSADGHSPRLVDVVLSTSETAIVEVRLYPAALRFDERLVVTPSREPRTRSDLPYPVATVEQDELARRLPRSTPDALADVPGLLLQKTNHGSGSPYIHGLLGNQVLVLVDGIRLNNSTFRFGPNQYLATIDPASIERIEVLRGAGAVLHGSDAIGGVINIITKRPELTTDGTRVSASMTARASTGGFERSGRIEMMASGRRVAGRAGFTRRGFGDLVAGGSLGVEAPSGYDERAADASLLFRPSERALVHLSYQHVRQGDVPRFDQVSQRGFERYAFDPQVRQLGALNVRHSPRGGPVRNVEATVSYHRSFERREIRRRGSPIETVEEDTVGVLGLTAHAAFAEWRGWSLATGIDSYADRVGSTRRDVAVATGAFTSRRGLYPDGARARSTAAFVSAATTLGRLTSDLGARYSRIGISAADPVFGSLDLESGAWIGQAGATWRLSPAAQLFGGVGQAFRAPNVDDVSTLGLFDSGVEVPSTNLAPERTWTMEGGVRLQAGRVAATASAFRTSLRDLIDRVRSSYLGSPLYEGQPVFQKANVQRAFVRGVEVEASYRPSPGLLVWGHATHVHGQQPALDEPMRRMPPLNGLLAARWMSRGGSWVEGRVRGAVRQTRLSAGDRADHRIDPAGTPGWVVLSAAAGRPLGPRVELVGALENVFDEAYRVHGSGIDGAGRYAWIGLRVK